MWLFFSFCFFLSFNLLSMPASMNLRTTYARFHLPETLEICSLVITPKEYSEILIFCNRFFRAPPRRFFFRRAFFAIASAMPSPSEGGGAIPSEGYRFLPSS
jgi:hypothetical protein